MRADRLRSARLAAGSANQIEHLATKAKQIYEHNDNNDGGR